jgi:hypothetical protein
MTAEHIELPQGTLDLLILRTLALGLEVETSAWGKLSAAVTQVLGTA